MGTEVMDHQKRKRKKCDYPKVWGGFGEKKSNRGTQWYIQDRVYDSDFISPALTAFKSDYWIVIRKCNDLNRK